MSQDYRNLQLWLYSVIIPWTLSHLQNRFLRMRFPLKVYLLEYKDDQVSNNSPHQIPCSIRWQYLLTDAWVDYAVPVDKCKIQSSHCRHLRQQNKNQQTNKSPLQSTISYFVFSIVNKSHLFLNTSKFKAMPPQISINVARALKLRFPGIKKNIPWHFNDFSLTKIHKSLGNKLSR